VTFIKSGLDTLSTNQIRAKLFRIEGNSLPPSGARQIEDATRAELIEWLRLAQKR
jgi:hypothetical protein